MTKQEALTILIEQTTLLNDQARETLLASLPTMTGEDMKDIGKLLATDAKNKSENIDREIESVNSILELIDKQLETSSND